jgi:hypothetical protein
MLEVYHRLSIVVVSICKIEDEVLEVMKDRLECVGFGEHVAHYTRHFAYFSRAKNDVDNFAAT